MNSSFFIYYFKYNRETQNETMRTISFLSTDWISVFSLNTKKPETKCGVINWNQSAGRLTGHWWNANVTRHDRVAQQQQPHIGPPCIGQHWEPTPKYKLHAHTHKSLTRLSTFTHSLTHTQRYTHTHIYIYTHTTSPPSLFHPFFFVEGVCVCVCFC